MMMVRAQSFDDVTGIPSSFRINVAEKKKQKKIEMKNDKVY